MTQQLASDDRSRRALPARAADPPPGRRVATWPQVLGRRVMGLLVVAGPIAWAAHRAVPEGADLVNRGGLALVDDFLLDALRPALEPTFLTVVAEAAAVTVVFAVLGTVGALIGGGLGALVLSDVVWGGRTPLLVRWGRVAMGGLLVAVRSIHELVWALLFVAVLGFDPWVAVLAIAVPFGAQTAKVFADTLDSVPRAPLAALRRSGAFPAAALGYGLLPPAGPLLLGYGFYRFECAIRSAVLLGVAGVGGLGQELVVSLQSRNWDEVWTLIWTVVLISAAVDAWSSRVRAGMTVITCADASTDRSVERGTAETLSRGVPPKPWALRSAALLLPILAVTWWLADLSLGSLVSDRTRDRAALILGEMWPPELPASGFSGVVEATLDTVAMAVLAMAVAVVLTLLLGAGAARPRGRTVGTTMHAARWAAFVVARAVLLVLRSIPPTVWAVIVLLALFPGVLPGALALGLYTGGILGRLVAESWESIDTRPREALRAAGAPPGLASLTAVVPPSAQHLVTYTLYRFEICVRDTAVVGVVGAAGLGRLLGESLATFNYPVVTTVLVASLVVSLASELVGRRLRSALRP